MRVHTEWRVGTDVQDIWVFEEARNLHLVLKGADESGEQRWEWQETEPMERPDPTLSLPSHVFKALTASLNGVLPASEATERHLKDATDVRDRLLAMVENAPN